MLKNRELNLLVETYRCGFTHYSYTYTSAAAEFLLAFFTRASAFLTPSALMPAPLSTQGGRGQHFTLARAGPSAAPADALERWPARRAAGLSVQQVRFETLVVPAAYGE